MEHASQKRELLGSSIEIKLKEKDSGLFSSCFSLIEDIQKRYSRFLDSSELSMLNSKLNSWNPATEEMISLLEFAVQLKKNTEGSFDITLKKALDNIGYDKDYSFSIKKIPKESIFSRIRGRLQEPIRIDKKNNRVFLAKEIDFGGFGKGYALDKVARFLDKKKISDYYINAGGDIFAKHKKKDDPWIILLEHPDDPEKAIGKIELNDMALACSAPNRRKWKNVHHLINAKTKASENSVKCIFVLAKTGAEADAYATGIFCLGFVEGITLSKKLPVEILMVSSENKMYKSDNFNAVLFD